MEEDLRSSGAGLRGFKSHPRHHPLGKYSGFLGREVDFFGLLFFVALSSNFSRDFDGSPSMLSHHFSFLNVARRMHLQKAI